MATVGRTNPRAGALRRDSTNAERALWNALRNRQLGGLKFRRQVTIGPYIADFACIEARIVVEADGGQHSPQADSARTAFLESPGYRVLRFWNHDILQNLEGALETILAAAKQRDEGKPSPNPLPHAGEGSCSARAPGPSCPSGGGSG